MTEAHILRIFRARVKSGREDEWNRLLDVQIPEQLVGVDGLIAWYAVVRPDTASASSSW